MDKPPVAPPGPHAHALGQASDPWRRHGASRVDLTRVGATLQTETAWRDRVKVKKNLTR